MIEFVDAFGAGEWVLAALATIIALLTGSLAWRRNRTRIPPSRPPTPEEIIPEKRIPDELLLKDEVPQVEEPPPPAPSMERALAATRRGLFDRLKTLFGANRDLNDDVREQLEEILYTSDLGPQTVEHLMTAIQEKHPKTLDFEGVRTALKDEINGIMLPVQDGVDAKGLESLDDRLSDGSRPRIWMIVGVNGVGKTTTIGKLASLMAQKGLKVLVAAGDTFRAAAEGQLKVWSERAAVEIFTQEGNAKPSGVAFDACQKAVKDGFDLVLLDTAGRLHTQVNLMEELKKIKRVIEKVVPGAPHQVLLVLDANSGQNALVQAREFNQALGVTGVILTKLDGTAKGGVAVGLAHELKLPIKAVGIGEKVGDLRPFSTREFVDSIL
ncbi:MAG TPA: signal recognition particle-docking protein FtsY [Bdellovibrionales bacterium]|nr:signal recognition particle-docking protein FtsY [Bdellovibrionales bacterium]